jgi:hypothetical protein
VPASYPSPSDPVSALTRADGTTAAHSREHGRALEIWENVRAWGAVGTIDVDNDDGPFIQAAIDSFPAWDGYTTGPGTVFMPPGFYVIRTPITVPSGMTIKGAGIGTSLYNGVNGANQGEAMFTADPGATRVTFADFNVFGHEAWEGTGPAITIAGFNGSVNTDSLISNVYFNGIQGASTWAISTTWSLETHIVGCHFLEIEGGCIDLGDTSNASVVRDCTISNGGYGAMGGILVSANGCLIEGNVIEGYRGDYGIQVTGDYNTLIRNWLEDNDGKMISVDGATGCTIQGHNTSGTVDTHGLYVNQCQGILIQQNNFNGGVVELASGAGLNEQTTAVLIANRINNSASGAAGSLTTTNLVNPVDEVVRLVERRGGFSTPIHGIEVSKGHVRLGSAAVLGWQPSIDAEIDVVLRRTAANTLALDTGDTFRIVGSVHASLPTASSFAAGAQYYCTGHKQPIWSDGSAWYEADGTTH